MTDFSWTDNVQALLTTCFPKTRTGDNTSSLDLGHEIDGNNNNNTAPTQKSISLCGWNLFGRRHGGAIQLSDSDEEMNADAISLFGRNRRRSRQRPSGAGDPSRSSASQPRAKRAPRVRTRTTSSSTGSSSGQTSHRSYDIELDLDSDADAPILDPSAISVQAAEEAKRKEERRQRRQMKKMAKLVARNAQLGGVDDTEEFEGFQGSGPGPVSGSLTPLLSQHTPSPTSSSHPRQDGYSYPRIPAFLPPQSQPYHDNPSLRHSARDARRAEFQVDDEAFVHVDDAMHMEDEEDEDADLGGGAYSLSIAQKARRSEGSASDGRSRSSGASGTQSRPHALDYTSGRLQLHIPQHDKPKSRTSKSSNASSSTSSTRKKHRTKGHTSKPSISTSSNSTATTATTLSELASPTHLHQSFVPSPVVVEEEDEYESRFPGVGFGAHARVDKQRRVDSGWGQTQGLGGAFLAHK